MKRMFDLAIIDGKVQGVFIIVVAGNMVTTSGNLTIADALTALAQCVRNPPEETRTQSLLGGKLDL
jgi:hypothetical protein